MVIGRQRNHVMPLNSARLFLALLCFVCNPAGGAVNNTAATCGASSAACENTDDPGLILVTQHETRLLDTHYATKYSWTTEAAAVQSAADVQQDQATGSSSLPLFAALHHPQLPLPPTVKSILVGSAESTEFEFDFSRRKKESTRRKNDDDATSTFALPASSSSSSGVWLQKLRSVLQDYRGLLNRLPVVTKSSTAGVVALVGDMLAQLTIERKSLSCSTTLATHHFDLYRSLTVAAEGIFVSGPLLHYAYDYLDEMDLPGVDPDGWIYSIVEVLIDILFMDSVFTATLMVTSALLQGRSLRQIGVEMREEYFSAARVSWLSSFSMSPLQFVNFHYVPVEFRVLITNFQDVLWNAAVSYMAHRKRKRNMD